MFVKHLPNVCKNTLIFRKNHLNDNFNAGFSYVFFSWIIAFSVSKKEAVASAFNIDVRARWWAFIDSSRDGSGTLHLYPILKQSLYPTHKDRITTLKPSSGWTGFDFVGIWQYRDLLFLLVRRDFVSQYKQTILGPAWFVLQPWKLSSIVQVLSAFTQCVLIIYSESQLLRGFI